MHTSPSSTSTMSDTSYFTSTNKHKNYEFIQRGRIELIIGPMFAGKSTELIRRVKRHEISGKKCLNIKYSEDQRY